MLHEKLEKQKDQLSDLDWARQVLNDISGSSVCDIGLATFICHELTNRGVTQPVRDRAIKVLLKISDPQRYTEIIELNSYRRLSKREIAQTNKRSETFIYGL